jgi:hypothetical protein
MADDILTVPVESTVRQTLLMTGNEYLSLPDILPRDGAIRSLNVLHMGTAGLVEFAGPAKKPLLRPVFSLQGQEIRPAKVWSYRRHWLPTFTAQVGAVKIRGTIFAPPGQRGGIYLLEAENLGVVPVELEAGFKVEWGGVFHHIFRPRQVAGAAEVSFDRWTRTLLLEAGGGLPLVSLALGFDDGRQWELQHASGVVLAGAAKKLPLGPRQKQALPLYMAVNREGSGAGTTVIDLRRHGFASLLDYTENWLAPKKLNLSRHGALANRNLFFNLFFAAGRAIDTDDTVPVTSRSPRYYVSAAFWSRDTLLWSFPGLLLACPQTAKNVLLAVFSRHLEKAGEHAHYINGVLLYPGFELDQLAAYVLALKHYLDATGDNSVLKESPVKKGLAAIIKKLLAQKDEESGLYATFLDPSDDPVKYPFLIYNNVLAQKALEFLSGLQKEEKWRYRPNLAPLAAALHGAIRKHAVADGPFGPMFAYAVDGRGNYQLYDNPPGSLQLLAHYGFCRPDEPIFVNTVRWIHSNHNPYFHDTGTIRAAASRHSPKPWPMSAANDLLALNLDGGRLFQLAPLDSGFCCETVDPQSGWASTGHAFATAAGFMAYALWRAYGRNNSREESRWR